jgi:hypothetical protein
MKRLCLSAAAALALAFCVPSPAQTITGIWQGKLPVPDNPRVILKIERSGDGSLHGGLSGSIAARMACRSPRSLFRP